MCINEHMFTCCPCFSSSSLSLFCISFCPPAVHVSPPLLPISIKLKEPISSLYINWQMAGKLARPITIYHHKLLHNRPYIFTLTHTHTLREVFQFSSHIEMQINKASLGPPACNYHKTESCSANMKLITNCRQGGGDYHTPILPPLSLSLSFSVILTCLCNFQFA